MASSGPIRCQHCSASTNQRRVFTGFEIVDTTCQSVASCPWQSWLPWHCLVHSSSWKQFLINKPIRDKDQLQLTNQGQGSVKVIKIWTSSYPSCSSWAESPWILSEVWWMHLSWRMFWGWMESPGSCFSRLEPRIVCRCCCSSSDSCHWMQGRVTPTCSTFSCSSLKSICLTFSCLMSRSWQQTISLEDSLTSFSQLERF